MRTFQNQEDYLQIAKIGATWCLTPGAPDTKDAMPYLATSNNADAWIIGAWCQYHTGGIQAIRKSRGHSWLVHDRMHNVLRVNVMAPYDHRDGVVVVS